MKLRLLALVACVLLPFQAVNADIAADVAANLEFDTIVQNAINNEGMSELDALNATLDALPEASRGDFLVYVAVSRSAQYAAVKQYGLDNGLVTNEQIAAADIAGDAAAAGPGGGAGPGLGNLGTATNSGGGSGS